MKKINLIVVLSLMVLNSIQVVNSNDSTKDEEPAFKANIYPLLEPIPIDESIYSNELIIEALNKEIDDEEVQNENIVEKEIVDWMRPCANSNVKSYMDYKAITLVSSIQYQYIQSNMIIKDGLLYEDDYIGVALGSWWGDIGSKWTIELDTGVLLKVVKVDEKSDNHTYNGCSHISDSSVIEFVIDSNTIPKEWIGSNGYILNGNFNNNELFNGNILRVAKGD